MPGPVFLDGETVTLHTIEEEDIDFLHTQVNDSRIWRPIGRGKPVTRMEEREFVEEEIADGDGVYLLIVADGDRAGIVSLVPIEEETRAAELGYWVAPAYQQNGYATAAAQRIVRYGFQQLNLHRIAAYAFAYNDASQRVLERVGFTHEGSHREAAFVDGAYRDAEVYGLLEQEWRADHG